MATKPLTTPEIWASNALYTTGPFIGSASKVVPPGATAAEGHRPGNLFPTPAEYENSQQNEITTWIVDWLFLGSSAGAADAHIVETNSSGRATLQGLTVNDAIDEIATSITGVGTVTPALLVTNTSGGFAIDATIGNTTATAISAQVGNGAGTGVLVTLTATPAGGEGILVTTSGATAAPAIKVDHNSTGTGLVVDCVGGSGTCVDITGNASATAMVVTAGAGRAAVIGTAGSNASAAVIANGNGTSLGVDGLGGTGSSAATGVRGSGLHADANGVHGRTSTSASTTAAGVFAEGRGIGTMGLYATSANGNAVVAQNLGADEAALRLVPQSAEPGNTPFGGDLYSNGTMNQLKHAASGQYYGIYQSPGGTECSACLINIASNAVYTNNSGVSWTDTIFPSLTEGNGNGYFGLSPGGEIVFTIVMDARLTNAVVNHIEVQVLDLTNGNAVIFSRTTAGGTLTDGYYLAVATDEWQRSLAISFQYSPPSEGDLDFAIQIRKAGGGGGQNVEARDVGCQIWGTIVP